MITINTKRTIGLIILCSIKKDTRNWKSNLGVHQLINKRKKIVKILTSEILFKKAIILTIALFFPDLY